jgi:ketosteroid isomerase-like protein
MAEQENVRTVQEIYVAFGRGDIPAILNTVGDDIDWTNAGPPDIPYARSRRGREQIAQFFATLNESVEVERFEPREYIAQGDQVVALGSWRARVRANGRVFDSGWAMVWRFRNGKVVGFRSYEDTAAVASAFRGA